MKYFLTILMLLAITSPLNAATVNPASPTNGTLSQLTAANFGTTSPGSTNGSVRSNPSTCTIVSGTGVKTFGGCVNAVFRVTGRNNGSGGTNRDLKFFIFSNATLSNGSGTNTASFSLSPTAAVTEQIVQFPTTGTGNRTVDVIIYGTFNVSSTQPVGSYSTGNSGGATYSVAVCSCNPSASTCAGAAYNASTCDTPGL